MSPPIRLYIDIQTVQGPHRERGIARYLADWTAALYRNGAEIAGLAFNPEAPPPDLTGWPMALDVVGPNTPAQLDKALRDGPLWYVTGSPMELIEPEAVFPEFVSRRGVQTASIFYDVIPLIFPERYLAEPGLRDRFHAQLAMLKRRDLLLSISEASRRDAIERLGLPPGRVASIGGGVSEFFSPGRPGEARALLATAIPDIDRPYVLCVAGFEPRKNVEGLFRAWARVPVKLREAHQLVITCKISPAQQRHWMADARVAGLRPTDLVLTGHVNDEVLRALYRNANLSVFPSFYEGFGLPVAEATACGCPTLAADNSSLPEVLPEPEALFPAADNEAMARLMVRGLTDQQFRDRLTDVAARAAVNNSWDRVAQRSLSALRAATRSPGMRSKPWRARVAMVGPFAPQPSGVATYNQALASALATIADVDCFVDQSVLHAPTVAVPGARMFPARALGTTISERSYEAIVHTMGNSEFHLETFAALQRVGGLVWMHDSTLAGMYMIGALRAEPTRRRERMTESLARCYGTRLPSQLDHADVTLTEHLTELGLMMTGEVARLADGMVFNSGRAYDLCRVDAGLAEVAHHRVIPLAFPTVPFIPQPNPNVLVGRVPLVVSLGWVDPAKAPELLLEAVAGLPCGDRARVALVGHVHPDYADELRAYGRRVGLGEDVILTGVVGDDEFWSWTASATAAVQLRRKPLGESSATVLQAMAAGTPVITNVLTAATAHGASVVGLRPAATASDITDALVSVITDPVRRVELSEAGRAAAAAWGFADVAAEFLSFALEHGR